MIPTQYDRRQPLPQVWRYLRFTWEGLHVRNVSEPTHIFHKGQVDRRAFQVGKAWYVETHGTGNNIYLMMDDVNQKTGALIFTGVDREMRRYLETNRILKWIKGIAC